MDSENSDLTVMVKLVVVLLLAALLMMAVGCMPVHAAEDGTTITPAPAPTPAPAATPTTEPAPTSTPAGAPTNTPAVVAPVGGPPAEQDHASPPIVPGPPRPAAGGEGAAGDAPAFGLVVHRTPNNVDVITGFQGMFQEDIDVPTATENWKIRGGGCLWLGYRRDIGDSYFSFGAKIGFRSFGLEQDNSTTGTSFHHTISTIFLMPNVRLSIPLGASKHVFFVDAAAGIGFNQFTLDGDVPDGTPRPDIDSSFAVNVVSGFLFNVYDGDAKLDLGFDLNFVAAQADITKLYPAGTTAANKFKDFDLGSLGLDFNLSVKF